MCAPASSHASSLKNYKLTLYRSTVGNVVDHANLFLVAPWGMSWDKWEEEKGVKIEISPDSHRSPPVVEKN